MKLAKIRYLIEVVNRRDFLKRSAAGAALSGQNPTQAIFNKAVDFGYNENHISVKLHGLLLKNIGYSEKDFLNGMVDNGMDRKVADKILNMPNSIVKKRLSQSDPKDLIYYLDIHGKSFPKWVDEAVVNSVNKIVRNSGAREAMKTVISNVKEYTTPHMINRLREMAKISPEISAIFKKSGLSLSGNLTDRDFSILERLSGKIIPQNQRNHYNKYKSDRTTANTSKSTKPTEKLEPNNDDYIYGSSMHQPFESKLAKILV